MTQSIVVLIECAECKCCLFTNGDYHHCWYCHSHISVKDLCGCGDCADKFENWGK